MIGWFRDVAPVRTKFTALGVFYTGAALTSLATTAAVVAGVIPGVLAIMAAAVVTGLVAMVAIVSRKLVCDPYVNTVVRMEGLARGDFASEIRYTTSRDCVGRMTKAMAVFRDNGQALAASAAGQREVVEALGAGLSRLADNDLTHRINTPFAADYEGLRSDFNRAMAAVSDAIGAVTLAANGINSGAADIRQASDDLSQRTEQQAASLEETAAAMDEITSTVRETAAGARRANDAVVDARSEAESSGEVVRRAVDAMGGIERASNEISEIIS
ncbi:methyl-accepting chemotaxis protein, partial [uncultured Sphingomonas sp.]|uniref:methyl-accepting chemotaxis protein n=1 Tax=uncultured Sphingomonas sp. TaxID=158754 RepID=UPI003748187C